MQDSTIKTLIIGDIIGESGLKKVFFNLKNIKNKYRIDLVIANGENSSNGFGITPEIANNLLDRGLMLLLPVIMCILIAK